MIYFIGFVQTHDKQKLGILYLKVIYYWPFFLKLLEGEDKGERGHW